MALGVAALTATSTVHAQVVPPPQYIPTDEYPPPSVRWKLVLGGVATTASFYALAQPFSYAWPDAPGGRDLRIPVAGPWIAIANNGCPADDPDCSKLWVWTRGILTALDGMGQAGGLLIALEGIFVRTTDEVPVTDAPEGAPPPRREAPEGPRDEPPARNLFIAPTPMGVGDSGVGLSISGSF
ncbi:MAG: hypothetical protein ACOC1F_13820 [Myxococcota bacterium]